MEGRLLLFLLNEKRIWVKTEKLKILSLTKLFWNHLKRELEMAQLLINKELGRENIHTTERDAAFII